MTNKELFKYLEGQGYYQLTMIKGKGLCGLFPFAYTIGLVVGIDEFGYNHRYCFPREHSGHAILTLIEWMKTPTEHPKSKYWIKRKGAGGDFTNPNYYIKTETL